MPLTPFQQALVLLLASNRTADSHLAGGAALHFAPNSLRYSNDLDYFHDSEERVASAFRADQALLLAESYSLQVQLNQPGYIRAVVGKHSDSTKVERAYDSAWRFLPVVRGTEVGYVLHPIDLAINKVLTLAGREEPRDLIDVLAAHENILPFSALVWAAPGKDPGFNPLSLLGMLRRRSKYRPEDFKRVLLHKPIDVGQLKEQWTSMLDAAEVEMAWPPADEVGCLYYSHATKAFSWPNGAGVVPHYATRGGVWPQVI